MKKWQKKNYVIIFNGEIIYSGRDYQWMKHYRGKTDGKVYNGGTRLFLPINLGTTNSGTTRHCVSLDGMQMKHTGPLWLWSTLAKRKVNLNLSFQSFPELWKRMEQLKWLENYETADKSRMQDILQDHWDRFLKFNGMG